MRAGFARWMKGLMVSNFELRKDVLGNILRGVICLEVADFVG